MAHNCAILYHKDRGAEGGVGRGCPTPHRGGDLGGGYAPSEENFLILAFKMVSFGAFWVVFFTCILNQYCSLLFYSVCAHCLQL